MSDWSGQLGTTANAHGVWMRNVPSFENIPTFPDDLELAFELNTDVTEVTETLLHSPNRGPATNPPKRGREVPPQPDALYDEAPNPLERTPPTFDMGMMPAYSSETEVTEEVSTGMRARALAAFRHAASSEHDREVSLTLELLEDWMEKIDEIELSADIEARPVQPAMIELEPLPATGIPALPRAASSRPLANRAPPPGHTPVARPPMAYTDPDPRGRRSHSQPGLRHSRPGYRASQPGLRARISGPARPATQPYDRIQQAGWWTAGALSGVLGATIISALSFAIVLLA